MGVNMVDIYVVWNFYECVEGDICFDGWCDVEWFIWFVGEVGFDVFLCFSLYICVEWLNGGIFFWVFGWVVVFCISDVDFFVVVDVWYEEFIL